ncbi:hypothetical protein B0J11DRAFT_500176 [Dendryphion nanum]|uniref:Uncharacterized protein n=1 Tax=Dendryphion nanum TaxID=256645 RepID=A0A9P9EEG5_9PLEO|nr:hypothetical protein B0J11DRAFT_500176 [Dendryphion nanum]
MLHHTLAVLTVLALSASIKAVPTAETTPAVFSFSNWIEGIIADPNGNHLTPEEAVAAARNAARASSRSVEKRAWCNDSMRDAPAGDAAACLDYLARRGADGTQCVIGNGQFFIQMCRIGRAEIVSSKSDRSAQGANCNDVARTGGLIFDTCWRADNRVKGSRLCISNRMFQVNINGL